MSLTADPGGEVTLETVRRIACALPGVEEGLSYGTAAFRVRKKGLARIHDSGEALVLKVDPAKRAVLMETDPVTFYITDHYANYPLVLVRLSTVSASELARLLEEAWRQEAPKRLVEAYAR